MIKRKQLVLNLLLDYQWHSTCEIESASIGGSQGTRRLRELRAGGHQIIKRKKANSTQYEYKLSEFKK